MPVVIMATVRLVLAVFHTMCMAAMYLVVALACILAYTMVDKSCSMGLVKTLITGLVKCTTWNLVSVVLLFSFFLWIFLSTAALASVCVPGGCRLRPMKNSFVKGVDQNFPPIFHCAVYTINKTFYWAVNILNKTSSHISTFFLFSIYTFNKTLLGTPRPWLRRTKHSAVVLKNLPWIQCYNYTVLLMLPDLRYHFFVRYLKLENIMLCQVNFWMSQRVIPSGTADKILHCFLTFSALCGLSFCTAKHAEHV